MASMQTADHNANSNQTAERVQVLDANRCLLMPCHWSRAKKLLKQGRAAVFRTRPFTIILKDRTYEDSEVQPALLGRHFKKADCRFKCACFDLDGTLCDSIALCLEMFIQALAPCCGFELSAQQVIEHFGLNEEGIIKRLAGPEQAAPALQRFYALYAQNLEQGRLTPFAGVPELIKALHDKGVLLFVITGKGRVTTDLTLKSWGLEPYLLESRCGGELQLNKAAHLRELAAKYGLKCREMVYVGDAVSDFEACARTGVPCISALWQPGQDSQSAAYLREHNPGWCFSRFDKAARYLLSHCSAPQQQAPEQQ